MLFPFFQFFVRLTLLCALSFLFHIFVLEQLLLDSFDGDIVFAYTVNYGLVFVIYTTLFVFQSYFKSVLGFLYQLTGLLKFAVFFLFFYPTYNLDGHISRQEFLAFFIPYAVTLAIGTYSIGLILNTPTKEK